MLRPPKEGHTNHNGDLSQFLCTSTKGLLRGPSALNLCSLDLSKTLSRFFCAALDRTPMKPLDVRAQRAIL